MLMLLILICLLLSVSLYPRRAVGSGSPLTGRWRSRTDRSTAPGCPPVTESSSTPDTKSPSVRTNMLYFQWEGMKNKFACQQALYYLCVHFAFLRGDHQNGFTSGRFRNIFMKHCRCHFAIVTIKLKALHKNLDILILS